MKFTMNSTKAYLLVWLGAVGLALALAVVSPNESRVMGHFPTFLSKTLSHQPVIVPQGLPADRTLALITFQRDQRGQAESWIDGLNLKNDPSIAWMRITIVNDPGTPLGRSEVEDRLLQRYTGATERANLVPVFTDRADFVRAASLNGVAQAHAVVVNRQGEVLARVEGKFDAEKARLLLDTLRARDPR